LGVAVYETKSMTSNEIQLPTSATGQYFVVIMLKDGSGISKKMMVQH
jgi:hypothetical protein